MIRADGLTVAAGPRTAAVVNVTLHVAAGDCVLLAGAPGTGTSTLLGLLAAAHRPAAGRLQVGGAEASTSPFAIRRQTCWVGARRLRGDGTVGDYLHLLAAARAAGDSGRVARALARTGLDGACALAELDEPEHAALDIATVLVAGAPVVLVDSPFDRPGSHGVWRDILSEARREGRAVVFTARDEAAVPSIWDRMVTMDGGRVVDERAAERLLLDTAWQVAHS